MEKALFCTVLSQFVSKSRKRLVGKGPGRINIHLTERFLIIELEGAFTGLQQRIASSGLLSQVEEAVEEGHLPLLVHWIEAAIDVHVVGTMAKVFPESASKVIVLIADRNWSEAEERIPLDRVNVDTLIQGLEISSEGS